MDEIVNSLLKYGYIILFLYSLGGGMVAIIAAGLLSASGKLDLGVSIAVAAIANFIGDSLLFYISRNNKAGIMPYFARHKRKLAYTHILMKKYGDGIIFLQKYIYGVKTLVPMAIGLTKYPFFKFNIINAVSAIVWAISLGLASYYMGDIYTKFSHALGLQGYQVALFVVVLLIVFYVWLNKVTAKKV